MKEFHESSNAQAPANHGRRNFLSLSLVAGSTLLLSAESHAQTGVNSADALAITNAVTLADSIALYASLLDDVRRLVLQKDAQRIYVAKYEATEWLGYTGSSAEHLRSFLEGGTTLTDAQKSELRNFLFEVASGGRELSRQLVRMRQEPLEEIKNLDTEFDKIRSVLTVASTAVKDKNTTAAKTALKAAIAGLEKYSPALVSEAGPGSQQGQAQSQDQQMKQQGLPAFQPVSVPASNLKELLQNVLELLNVAPPNSDQNHSTAYASPLNFSPVSPTPVVQSGIRSVLNSKLTPGTIAQFIVAYGLAFPILLRVSDKNNRLKLLNDVLRIVPPGLRDPALSELANALANLP